MTDAELKEIARACAKAKPQSYYAEPFEPHEWVMDALREVERRVSSGGNTDLQFLRADCYDREVLVTSQGQFDEWIARRTVSGQEAQPVLWVRVRSDGSIAFDTPLWDSNIEQVRKESGSWIPLVRGDAAPIPATEPKDAEQ